MNLQTVSGVGIILIFAGIIIIFSAIVLITRRGKNGTTETKAGGAILIGPIPIVFGTDKQTVKTVLDLSIILTRARCPAARINVGNAFSTKVRDKKP